MQAKGKAGLNMSLPKPVQTTDEIAAPMQRLGGMSWRIVDGEPRQLCLGDTEVLRRLSYGVRNADCGTCAIMTQREAADVSAATAR